MAMFIALIIIEFIILGLNLRVLRNDLLSPATISSLGFIAATIFAFFCIDIWSLQLSWQTFIVIVSGLLMMTIGELAGVKIRIGKKQSIIGEKQSRYIYISSLTQVIFTVSIMIATLLYVYDAIRVGTRLGGSGFQAVAYMKEAYTDGGSQRMNVIIRQLFKVVVGSAYISCYLLANNCFIFKEKLTKNIGHLMVILCGIFITIASGSRTDVLRIFSAFIFDYSVLTRLNGSRSRRENKLANKKIIKRVIPLAFIVAIIVFASRTIVKTSDVLTSGITSGIYYIAYYIGSPIAVLNIKIQLVFSNGGFLLGSNVEVPEFVYLGRLNYGGNVGTFFMTSLLSHGWFYMLLHTFAVYFVESFLYKKIFKGKLSKINHCYYIVICSSWYYACTMSYYGDVTGVFSRIVTNLLTNFVMIVLMIVMTKNKKVADNSFYQKLPRSSRA